MQGTRELMSSPENSGSVRRYRAFISYSHQDRPLALALQRALHRLGRAWYRRPAFAVFRDDTSLTATPHLWASIQSSMHDSEWLILIVSPAAAASTWVDREIRWWLEQRGADRLLLVLADGEIWWDDEADDFDRSRTTALPPALFGAYQHEPRWTDLRAAIGAGRTTLRDPVFQDRVANIAALLHGRAKEELVGEELRQQRTWSRVRNTAVTAMALVTAAAITASFLFVSQRDEARRQTAMAEARELAARADRATNPYEAVALAVEAELRTEQPLPEARAAYANAVQRTAGLPVRPVSPAITTSTGWTDVSWVPDGSGIAVASANGWQLRDDATGRPLAPLHVAPDEHEVYAMAWSTDGKHLATADMDTEVVVWDASSGSPLGPPVGEDAHPPGEPLTTQGAVAWSSDGARLVSAGPGNVVLIHSVVQGRPVGQPLTIRSGGVETFALSPDGTRLATAGFAGGAVRIWDTSTGAAVGPPLPGDGGWISELTWSPDGSRLAGAGLAGTTLWTLGERTPDRQVVDEELSEDVAWSPDGNLLAAVGFDVQLFDAATGDRIGQPAHDHETGSFLADSRLVDIDWSPAGDRLVTGAVDGTMRIWALTPMATLHSTVAVQHTGEVSVLAWSGQGAQLVSGDWEGKVKVRDMDDGAGSGRIVTEHDFDALSTSLAPDGSRLAIVGGIDSRFDPIQILDVTSGAEISTLTGHPNVRDVAWSPRWPWLASISDDGSVWLWDADAGVPVGPPLSARPESLVTVSWSPGGDRLAIGDSESIRVFDFADSSLLTTLGEGRAHSVLAWSPDGSRLASVGAQGRVYLYDVSDGVETVTATGMLGRVGQLSWHPRAPVLAAAAVEQGTVVLIDGERGAPLGTVVHPETQLTAIAFTPDGSRLATGGHDGTVRLWGAVLERSVCEEARAALSPDVLENLIGPGRPAPRCSDPAGVESLPPLPVVPLGMEEPD
ncbi:toll/interleukin-1 receptor domain-containing protein [Geodermatophilus sp. SYSU D00691]